jgi:hypothetical protein
VRLFSFSYIYIPGTAAERGWSRKGGTSCTFTWTLSSEVRRRSCVRVPRVQQKQCIMIQQLPGVAIDLRLHRCVDEWC